MAKKPKVILPKKWQRFPAAYSKTLDYWYFPKGLAATVESVRDRMEILQSLNGLNWRDAQPKYVRSLNEAQVSRAEAEWKEGGAPLARMLVQVMRIIGLAWINPVGRVEITQAGEELLNSATPEDVLSTQVDRYQFWNPTIHARVHRDIRVHPIPFLAEVMRTVEPRCVSALEYELIVSRARSFDEVDSVVAQIEDFRTLSGDQQDEVARQCDAFMIGGKKRSSLYNTIRLNRSYALAAITLSKLFERDGTGLKFRQGALTQYRARLQRYQSNHTYIEFDSVEDWIAYFGDPAAEPTAERALEYYVGKGDVTSAVALKRKQGAPKEELREFKEMILTEKSIEDYLEQNLDYIGKATSMNLELIKRQYSTTVGPIDLLCRDKKSKDYLVVELKKGRSADRVYGQCSRYMGWVRKNLGDPDGVKTHGAIVARQIDKKLMSARDAHDTKVALIEFSMKASARVV
jgi:hypothetical protein